MTIELITGTPGSGKTCYAVSQRLVSELKRKVVCEDNFGVEYVVQRRLVVAGIRGLALPHELLPHPLTGQSLDQRDIDAWNALDASGDPVHKRLPFTPAVDVEASLFNWWLWCKPGDLIVVDEVQFVMARGTLNKKSAPFIALIAMHRHYGVDFLFITQHPDFLDPFVRKLVGMHRHVRSVMGMSLCMVYEWDHASNPERYSTSAKSRYLRRAEHFKLYKSSAAHIPPPTAGRGIFKVFGGLLIVGASLYAYSSSRPGSFLNVQPAPLTSAVASATAFQPGQNKRMAGFQDAPKVTGCYSQAERCVCIGIAGLPVGVSRPACLASLVGYDGLVQWEPRPDYKPVYAAPKASGTPPGALASLPSL